MNNAWENLNKTWKERLEKLEDAMQAAVQYQDTLQVRNHKVITTEITGSVLAYSESSMRVDHLYKNHNILKPETTCFCISNQFPTSKCKKYWYPNFYPCWHVFHHLVFIVVILMVAMQWRWPCCENHCLREVPNPGYPEVQPGTVALAHYELASWPWEMSTFIHI